MQKLFANEHNSMLNSTNYFAFNSDEGSSLQCEKLSSPPLIYHYVDVIKIILNEICGVKINILPVQKLMNFFSTQK